MEQYPVAKDKLIILIAGFEDDRDFRSWYLEEHAPRLAALPPVTHYKANRTVDNSLPGLTSATNGDDPYGVQAIDEVYGAEWSDIAECYRALKLLGVYRVTEYALRELLTDRPLGMRTPEIKRFGLLTKPADKTHDEAMKHWIEEHPQLCYRYLSGMATYFQNHIDKRLTKDSLPLDGFPVLSYWNLDALKYGHFCSEEIKKLLVADCMKFRSTSFVVTVDEYIFK